ncbi:Inversin [Dactylellina cionopaga]|nr:Inversin [Dactylellina cionopaga]
METNSALRLKTHDDYTVGWVCALPKEQTAATAMLDERHNDNLPKLPNDNNTYTLGSIGRHNIVIACLPKGRFGNVSAASVAIQMINTFPSIKFGLMVGIGSGIPNKGKVRLGDVVVGVPVDQFPGVIQWDSGYVEGGSFMRTGSLNKPPNLVLTALSKLETEQELNGPRIPEYLGQLKAKFPRLLKYLRSDSLEDILFKADYDHINQPPANLDEEEIEEEEEEEQNCRSCDRKNAIRRTIRDMRIHYGLIASGNQLVRNAPFRDKLNKEIGGRVLCVETEAAGLLNDFPCIVIRGICDYADSHKNDKWQEHAAAVAAAFAKELLQYIQPSDVERESPAKAIVEKLPILEANVAKVNDKLNEKTRLKILAWLGKTYGPEQSSYINLRQPGTGQWLLRSIEFQEWLENNDQVMFCPGDAGAGKTIVTSIVVDYLRTLFKKEPSTIVAYIYCNYQTKEEQTLENILASLLRQLSQNQMKIPPSVRELYKDYAMEGIRPPLERIYKSLISVAGLYSRCFIIVDALDESLESCRQRLLTEIFNFQETTKANLFATSRFIPEITSRFEGSLNLTIRARDEDIQVYIEDRVTHLSGIVGHSPDLQEKIKTDIVSSIDGMFLLAKLYLDSLGGIASHKGVEDALMRHKNESDTYKSVYDDTMRRINQQPLHARELAMKVLSWVALSKQLLLIDELQKALAVDIGHSSFNEKGIPDKDCMISFCGGLVTITSRGTVRLVHKTTSEYFEQTRNMWFPAGEAEIAKTCVTYLSYDAFKAAENVWEKTNSDGFYKYAALNWGFHARLTIDGDKLISKLLEDKALSSVSGQVLISNDPIFQDNKEVPPCLIGVPLAAYIGLPESMRVLLRQRCNLHARDSSNRTPLWWAVERGHDAVVEVLADMGANLEREYRDDGTALCQAVKRRHEAMVRMLVCKGANMEGRDAHGRTPLSVAAGSGLDAVVKLFLDAGADFEAKDSDYNRTPLSWSALNGHEKVVELLIERGADINSIEDWNGRTPLLWATIRGHEAVVKLLVGAGADLGAWDRWNRQTSLIWAARYGLEMAVSILVEKGAGLEFEESSGRTALSYAAENGYASVVAILVENGANLETKSYWYDRSPLSYAAENGHIEVVIMLVRNGADFEARDSDYGRTPLLWAASMDHHSVVKLLAQFGANLDARENEYYRKPNSSSNEESRDSEFSDGDFY